jgi:hypothetical protein
MKSGILADNAFFVAEYANIYIGQPGDIVIGHRLMAKLTFHVQFDKMLIMVKLYRLIV